MVTEYVYTITDRETRKTWDHVPPDAPCRIMRRFAEGAITRAEWRSLEETIVRVAAEQGWPVAMVHDRELWLYARAFDVQKDLSPAFIAYLEEIRCKHHRVTRGRCSDGCAQSKAVATPHHREPDGIPFLMGSCRFCHAALIDVCDDCNECVL